MSGHAYRASSIEAPKPCPATAVFSALKPVLPALALATLVSGLFFVRPGYVFTLNRPVLQLAVYYLPATLFGYFFSWRLQDSVKW